MEAVSEHACKVANRVALGMSFGESSGHRSEARQIVKDVLNATCDLLDKIDPIQLRQWFEQFHLVYEKSSGSLVDNPAAWSRFLGSQCDVLSAVGLHQKTIASVGDAMSKWNREAVSYDALAETLDSLAGLVSDHAASLGDAIEGQAGFEARLTRRTDLFTNAVIGLVVVLISINEAIKNGDPRDLNCAALAAFGAALAIDSVKPLWDACELPK